MKSKTELQKIIYKMSEIDPYASIMIQELSIKNSKTIPTACLKYDKKKMDFEILLNPDFYNRFNFNQKMAIMIHEIYHFLHGHTFRFLESKDTNMTLYNIAADMSINQYIQNLPDDCVKVEDWKLKDNTPMPKYKPMEFYYEVLKKTTQDKDKATDDTSPDPQTGEKMTKADKTCNTDKMSVYKQFDIHDVQELSEIEKYGMMKSAKDLIQRSLEKAYFSFDKNPGGAQELLDYLDSNLKKMNFKALLKQAIKKSLSTDDFKYTFKRPSRRYGLYYKGRLPEDLPKVELYVDCSGSISINEIQQFTDTIEALMKNYKKSILINFFHTSIFHSEKFKKLDFSKIPMESGGTDVSKVVQKINESKADMSFVLTDGYFSYSHDIKTPGPVFWLITNNGTTDHPYKKGLNTFMLDLLK